MKALESTYVSRLNGKLDVVAEFERIGDAFSLGKVEKYLANDIAPLDESKTLLQRAHHALISHWMGRIF